MTLWPVSYTHLACVLDVNGRRRVRAGAGKSLSRRNCIGGSLLGLCGKSKDGKGCNKDKAENSTKIEVAEVQQDVYKRQQLILRFLVIFMIFGTAFAMVGCGGGFAIAPQAKTYTLTITGTNGAVTHSTTVLLTVK